MTGRRWTLLTDHAGVLVYLLENPEATTRTIVGELDLPELTVARVLQDLRIVYGMRKMTRKRIHQRVMPTSQPDPKLDGMNFVGLSRNQAGRRGLGFFWQAITGRGKSRKMWRIRLRAGRY